MRRWMSVVVALSAGTALVAPLRAQAAAVSTASSCNYTECALRFEGRRLVRGASGRTVAKMGLFHSSAIDTLLAGADSAAANARLFVGESRKSWIYSLLGTTALVFARVHSDYAHDVHAVDWSAIGVGFVMIIPAGRHAQHASSALSRSVWWYNSALTR